MDKHLNFSQVVVKMDSHVVFVALHSSYVATSPFAMLISDCQMLTTSMDNIVFSFAKQYVNSVSHTIIRISCTLLDRVVWYVISSKFLIPNLNYDCQ